MSRVGPIFLLGVAACASPSMRTVPRVVDGQVENGPFVSPYAYEWFIEGEVSAAKGRHGEAAMAFEAATAAPADDVVLMARLAEEYELSGEIRRADRTLSLARRYYPKSARVALAEGRIQRSRGKDDEALSAFVRAKELAPAWEEPIIALARMLVAGGHRQRANAILLAYVETLPRTQSEHARRVLIDLARHAGDAETLERVLSLDPSSTPTARAREAGELALAAGHPALAARILSDALDAPENIALWLQTLRESGDQETARAFLLSADSERLGGVADHANLLLEIGEVERALELLETVATSPQIEYSRGRALLARGDYVEAAGALADVPFGAASFEDARVALADCTIAQGRQGAGAEALSLAPHDSLAVRAKLAEIYLEQGELRAGLRLFDPKQRLERAALAAFFERAGHFEEAAAYYASVKLMPSDEPQIRARASAEWLASRGHHRGAIVVLERWTADAPEDLYARVRLVELLQQTGNVQAAEKRARHALEAIDDPVLRARLIDVLGASAAAAQ